jgi:hypothetical protein
MPSQYRKEPLIGGTGTESRDLKSQQHSRCCIQRGASHHRGALIVFRSTPRRRKHHRRVLKSQSAAQNTE